MKSGFAGKYNISEMKNYQYYLRSGNDYRSLEKYLHRKILFVITHFYQGKLPNLEPLKRPKGSKKKTWVEMWLAYINSQKGQETRGIDLSGYDME